jgi:hypothetical protein
MNTFEGFKMYCGKIDQERKLGFSHSLQNRPRFNSKNAEPNEDDQY